MKQKNAAGSGSERAGAKYWIKELGLAPHPEGGYFRQTYKAELTVELSAESHPVAKAVTRVGQPVKGTALRAASTAIYFLIEGENFSAFHRLRSDEMWHFYAGSALIVHVIDRAGRYSSILLGRDVERGEVFQTAVKAGCWFASELAQNPHPSTGTGQAFSQNQGEVGQPSWALVGCTVAPGFEFEDFELAKKKVLVRQFPKHQKLIERLTRE